MDGMRLLQISDCLDCKHHRPHPHGTGNDLAIEVVCNKADRMLRRTNLKKMDDYGDVAPIEPPDWCPLPKALHAVKLSDLPAQKTKCQWGFWRYKRNRVIEMMGDGHFYEVDLDECRTSAEILDWVFQIRKKTWATERVMHDLLSAIDAILDPQANFCSSGASKKPDVGDVLSKYQKRLDAHEEAR